MFRDVQTPSAPASRALLDAIPVFGELTAAEREFLLPHCRVRVYRRGETLFREGEGSTEMSFVVLGSVKVVKTSQERSVVIGLLGPGEPIGIVAALERVPYPGTAVAVEPSTILQIPERDFFAVGQRHPEITRRLFRFFMQRQAELAQRLQDMTVPVERRVARALLVLEKRIGKKGPAGTLIPMVLNRQDVADLAGTTIETAIRIMSRWGKQEIVLTEENGFRVPDMARLQAIADGDSGRDA